MAHSSDGEYAPDTSGSASSEDLPAKQVAPMGASRGRYATGSQRRVEDAPPEGNAGGSDPPIGITDHPPTLPGMPQLQPAGDFDRRFAMSGAHDRWQGIATSTSKCDVCRKNRRGILYMCRQCSRNVCTECVQEGNFGDDKHRFDPKDVVWKAPAKKGEAKVPATPATSGDQAIVVPQNAAQGASDRTRGEKGGQARATLYLAVARESIGHNQSQPHCEHQPTTHQSPEKGGSNSNVPHECQTGYTNHNTSTDTQLAAATLEEMRSGSCGIDDDSASSALKVHSRQNHVPSAAEHDQERMNSRPSQSKLRLRPPYPGRFEPYDLHRNHAQRRHDHAEEKRSRSSTPFVALPSPRPPRGVSIDQRHLPQAQTGVQMWPPLPTDAGSRQDPSHEVGIPPETIPNSAQSQVVHHHGAPLRSSKTTTNSSHRFPTSASLEPLVPAQTLPPAAGPLPPIQQMVPCTPPTPFGRPFSRSVRQTYFNGPLVRESTARVMSPSQAARMASVYQPPPVSRIEGPPCSPLTGKNFPPAQDNAEAYGQWQIFKAHSELAGNRNVDVEACLLQHTSNLWTHILKQPPHHVESKLKLVVSATWYAVDRLAIAGPHNRAMGWLKDLQRALFDQGYGVEGRYLDKM